MLYLGNNEMGSDAACIGFPSIDSCEAIVYQTSACLYAIHEMPSGKADAFAGKAAAFAQWVQQQSLNHGGLGVALYGVINQEKRWSKIRSKDQTDDWANELIAVSTALGWGGAIWRGRVTSHISKTDSVYVRFDAVNNGGTSSVTVGFKRWSKMELDADDRKPLNLVFQRDQLSDQQKETFSEAELQGWIDAPTFKVAMPDASSPNTPGVYSVHRKNKPKAQEGNLNPLTLQRVR
jgi:hypothetical protein